MTAPRTTATQPHLPPHPRCPWSETPPVTPQHGPPRWLVAGLLYACLIGAFAALGHQFLYLLSVVLGLALVGGLLLLAWALCAMAGLAQQPLDTDPPTHNEKAPMTLPDVNAHDPQPHLTGDGA